MIDAFQTKDKHRVFIATLGAGGVGITLTSADVVIFYDTHWAPALNNQAADRLHRIGQKNCVNVVTLRVTDSVEEHVARTWATKQELISGMIGDEEAINRMTAIELENLL
jgi:SNF2 family DNA or RNA helicase